MPLRLLLVLHSRLQTLTQEPSVCCNNNFCTTHSRTPWQNGCATTLTGVWHSGCSCCCCAVCRPSTSRSCAVLRVSVQHSKHMPRRSRRTAAPTLFALTSAARLNAVSCFCTPRLQHVQANPCFSSSSTCSHHYYCALPPLTATATVLTFTATTSAGHSRQRTTRRRARPLWNDRSAATLGTRGISTVVDRSSRGSGRRSLLSSNLGADDVSNGASKGPAAEARVPEPGKRAAGVPLTHDQLPEESLYLLDGTSMLFRAFYGRGAGG